MIAPRWEQVAKSFEIDGSTMLLWVEGHASVDLWQQLLDHISSRGPGCRYLEHGILAPATALPSARAIFERRLDLERPYLQTVAGCLDPGIGVWVHFSQLDPMWMSLSQKDVQSQAELDALVRAMRALARRLQRSLSLTNEWGNGQDDAVLRYDIDSDATLAWR